MCLKLLIYIPVDHCSLNHPKGAGLILLPDIVLLIDPIVIALL